MHRRELLISALAAVPFPASSGFRTLRAEWEAAERLSAIERRVAGRLGVMALDTGTGRRLSWRADQRFPMCSTFKWALAAQVLARVDSGREQLDRAIAFGPGDLLEYAPVTRQHLADGAMSVSALCAAAVQYSDNTAANLLLATIGGPGGLTAWLRGLGDAVTRLDRTEPELNSAIPGDPRDTTTPRAMAASMRRVLLGRVLSEASRQRLLDWLKGNTTGDARLRAGLPAGWTVGDKTGSGANGASNDVAIVWPTGRQPLLITAYLTETSVSPDRRNTALAEVGRRVAEWLG